MIDKGNIKITDTNEYKGKRITYHDSCYLGRGNNIYEAPRQILEAIDADLYEMKRSKKNGLCCGAGGAQMFKEEEHGGIRINEERTKDVLDTKSEIVVASCPFCITMLQDGLKANDKQDSVKVLDIVELLNTSI